MIAHVLYRSKRFDESNQYLEQLFEVLNSQKKTYFEIFYPKYVLLKAANSAFSSHSQHAIELLEDLLKHHRNILTDRDESNTVLNLGLYYFHLGNFKKVVEYSLKLHHSDQWYEKKMGKEWIVKKNLCEMMFHYDFGNLDLAFNKLRSIERNHADIFKHPKYQNAKSFLQLIKAYFDQPNLVSKSSFVDKVDETLEFLPFEEEDLQAVSFYAWLKSKMTRKTYYQALLDLINEESE